jgi:hypothetical protein
MDDLADDRTAFLRMAREFPVRTAIFTFGLPVFALLQFVNAHVHGASMAAVGLFSLGALACSVLLTRYHLARYRRRRLAVPSLDEGDDPAGWG